MSRVHAAQVDLHRKRAKNPTYCRLPKYELVITLQNGVFVLEIICRPGNPTFFVESSQFSVWNSF
jgi:hypothetical protein